MKMISYGKQFIDQNDVLAVSKALKRNVITSGDLVEKFEKNLSNYFKSKYSTVCNSGTSALHLAFKAANLKKNDVVLMPSINFISSYNLCSTLEAKIYLIDTDPVTGQISYESVLNCIKKNKIKKIKIIITMYLGGYVSDNIKIFNLKKKYKFLMIEDACHALGSEYLHKNKKFRMGCCKHSDMSVFSLHPLKTITSGEGGIISTNNKILNNRLKIFRSHGIIRNKKKHWDYQIKLSGFNYRLSDINCALGLSQLKKINKFIYKRRKIALEYVNGLKLFTKYVKVMNKDKIKNSSCHLVILEFNFKNLKINKDKLLSFFLKEGFFLQQHYKPIFLFDVYKNNKRNIFPVAQVYYDTSVSFPVYFHLKKNDLLRCIKILKKLINKKKII